MVFVMQKVWEPSTTDLSAGRRPLWWTVGPSGTLAVLFVDRRQLEQISYIKGWVGWVPEVPFDGVLVIRHADGSVQRRTFEAIPRRPSHIALLPDARLLIAAGRAGRDDSGAWAPNASVFSLEGEERASFCIGDDIDVLVTDSGGSIWTAYGDEGIYGGHPQSAAGLAGWGDQGQVVWAPNGRLPEWPLAGCAAATEGDCVWLAWYSSNGSRSTFLTRITPLTGEVASWLSPVPSPDGLAVRGNHAILTRRVHNERSTEVFRAELVGASWVVTDRHKEQVPGRVVLRCGQGRDGFLWLRTGDTWLRIDA
ncbi:hypothetical protein [Micromonospora coerulea]|uniref:hypothetical protein n=1 Tax=Micromonospora coerulea TaxID=47856 RepID=UPI001906951C|nr:hypothetical protein [Micromonospora veneta]